MAIKFSVALQGSYPIRDYIDKSKRIEQFDFDEALDLLSKKVLPHFK